MSKTILEIVNLKKHFNHNNKIIKLFNNVNLKIQLGDLVALTGPSGSGKSTLLHLLALLDEPTSGKIILNKRNIKDFQEEEKDKMRREKVSIIFQDNNLLSDFTALENVAMPLIIKGEKTSLAVDKTKKILKNVKILDRSDHFPSEMSGGEQQRTAIARALIAETDIILADEPTGNLDYKTSKEIFSYFLKLKKMNKAIIFATHNRELANMADYKLRIFNGNIKRINGSSK